MALGTIDGLGDFVAFMAQPANLPIVIVTGLMFWFTWVSFRGSRRPRS